MTEKTEGKGRPTPKRSQKAKAYVAPPPTNRREAAKALRAKQATDRTSMRSGMKNGVESSFLKRDQGPERSFVRDIVDSQRALGPVLLPFMVGVIAIGVVGSPQLYAAAFLAMLAVIFVVVLDSLRLGRQIGKRLDEKFPKLEAKRGHVFYGLQRTTLIRRWRTPPAKVAVGDTV